MAAITISRQFGSEGLAVAKRTAEILGYTCLDRTLVAQVARIADLPEKDRNLYHLTVNTERTGVERAARLIADAAERNRETKLSSPQQESP